jgi:hypothetical protein
VRVAEAVRDWRGPLYHLFGGLLVFLLWRVTGMPSPGLQGRLIPLAWVVLGLLTGRSGIPRFSAGFLGAFSLLVFLWRIHPALHVLAGASAVLGMFPGIMATAAGGARWSLARAAAPLFLLSVLLVPFEGDEPHYAAILAGITGDEDSPFQDPGPQLGDLATGETHHTRTFPLLLLPGYPFGQIGVRAVSFLMALAAVMLTAHLFRSYGISIDGGPAVMALLVMPGAGLLGLLYPGWVSIALFVAGALWLRRGKNVLPVLLALTLILAAIKMRFFFLGAGLLVVWFLRLERGRKWRCAAIIMGIGAAVLAADYFLLGGGLVWARYGNVGLLRGIYANLTVHTVTTLTAPLASMLDIEAGMLWKAPWVVLALAGLPALRKRHPDLYTVLGVPSLIYIIVVWIWLPFEWHSMPTPPGRLFMPLMPLLLASASMVLGKRSAWVLIWLSMAVSALCVSDPWLRFNHADGTDTIISMFTSGSAAVSGWLPSWSRPSVMPFILWGAFLLLLVVLVPRRGRGVQWALLAAALGLGLASTGYPGTWYASSLGPEYRTGCSVYPENPDPLQRTFWLFRRTPLLAMGHPLDSITLPAPPGEGPLEVSVLLCGMASDDGSVPGLDVSSGGCSETVFVDSPVQPTPAWVRMHGKEGDIARVPENMADTLVTVVLEDPGEDVVLSPDWSDGQDPLPAGLYLDRIEIGRI